MTRLEGSPRRALAANKTHSRIDIGGPILVCSPVRIWREALCGWLGQHEVHADACEPRREALDYALRSQPVVLVVDLSFPLAPSLIHRTLAMSSNTTVVGVNIGDSQAAAVDAFALGCTCALDASEGLEVLWYAIVSAAQQDARSALTQLRQAVRRLILYGPPVSSSDLPGLSQREQEITLLIAADLTNKQIAAELNLSVSTVKNHVHNILGKLGVRDRQQAAASLQRRPVDDAIDLAMDRR